MLLLQLLELLVLAVRVGPWHEWRPEAAWVGPLGVGRRRRLCAAWYRPAGAQQQQQMQHDCKTVTRRLGFGLTYRMLVAEHQGHYICSVLQQWCIEHSLPVHSPHSCWLR